MVCIALLCACTGGSGFPARFSRRTLARDGIPDADSRHARKQEKKNGSGYGVFYVLSEMLCGFLDTEASTRTGAERRYVGRRGVQHLDPWIRHAKRNAQVSRKLASFVLARRTAQISKKGG